MLNPNSSYRCSTQRICLQQSDADMYSDSVDDNAVIFCFLDDHRIGTPASIIKLPLTAFLPTVSEAQSASAYAISPSFFVYEFYNSM